MQKEVGELLSDVEDRDSVPKSLLKMESLEQQLRGKVKSIEKGMSFYEDNDTCPSCKQNIQDHHKDSVIEEKKEERKQVEKGIEELLEKISETENRLSEINSTLNDVGVMERKINERQSEVSATTQYISKVQGNIEEIENEGDDIQQSKDEMKQAVRAYRMLQKDEDFSTLQDIYDRLRTTLGVF